MHFEPRQQKCLRQTRNSNTKTALRNYLAKKKKKIRPNFKRHRELNPSTRKSTCTVTRERFGWCDGRKGDWWTDDDVHAVLDEPPSLAVALHLVLGLGAGVAQRRHLVQQGVVRRLAKQGHQQRNTEAGGSLALHAEAQCFTHHAKLILSVSLTESFHFFFSSKVTL